MILLSFFACSDPPPPEQHHLSDLFRPMVQLNTGSVPGGPEIVQLLVHPEFPGVCHPIEKLTATLDGKPMTRLHGRVEGATPYDRDCAVFEFSLAPTDIVAGPTNDLVVTDGTSTWHMTTGAIFAERKMSLATPGPVKAGDTVTLDWSPVTDTLDPKAQAGVELVAGKVRKLLRRADVTFGGGKLSFTMPEGITGDVDVTVFGTESIRPPITTCDGPHTCGVSRSYSVPAVKLVVSEK